MEKRGIEFENGSKRQKVLKYLRKNKAGVTIGRFYHDLDIDGINYDAANQILMDLCKRCLIAVYPEQAWIKAL